LQAKDQNIDEGRQLVLRELDRLDLVDQPLSDVAERMNMKSVDDMFAAVGAGDLRTGQVVHAVLQQADRLAPRMDQQELPLLRKPESSEKSASADDVYIEGVGNLLTNLANCCQPVPGDDIRGYVTLGRGVNVHRSDCENLLHLEMTEPQRVLQVSWGSRPTQHYPVDMQIQAYDRTGLLRDVSGLLANERVNVLAVNTQSNPGENTAHMSLTVEVESLEGLSRLMNKIAQLPNVISARRVRGGQL